ncbi:MAG: DUF4838 domain-containing protein [Planctomycetota bacterium]
MSLRRIYFTIVIFAFLPVSARAQDDLALVENGATAYVIYHAPDAPASVKLAAEELQRAAKLSTGVEIPIRNEPAERMICLGDNPSARDAGLTATDLPDDAFLIATKGANLYILGKDTADPPKWKGWTSQGTLFGAYEFLERVVGVRWLLPGEWGEEIPKHAKLTAPQISLKEVPDFALRLLTDVQDKRPPQDKQPSEAQRWLLRHKIVSQVEGRKINQGHSWDDYVSEETVKAHPEYLAVSAETGKPWPCPRHKAVKYCTNNDELVRVFTEGVVQALEKRPWLRCGSISPSDGGAFCQCPKCMAQVTTDPHGNPSHTLAILDFYNRVAKAVREKCPDRLLGGIVYYNYMYPPEKPATMEPNMYLVWAPLNYYGWGLAKPAYRDEFERVLVGWLAVTRNFVYHNYSTWMRSYNGAPLPPGLEILKFELPTLKKHNVWGVDMVGIGAWGYGGPANYILARQMWDADVDVDALFKEWLRLAYGPGWRAMHDLYTMLDARMMDRKRREPVKYSGEQYEVNRGLIEEVHLPVFPEMERLYREALSKAETEAQRKRLEMFGDNLVMLHYNMREAGMLKEPEQSSFYRTDEAYAKFLADTEFSLALYRNHGKRYTGPIWEREWRGD